MLQLVIVELKPSNSLCYSLVDNIVGSHKSCCPCGILTARKDSRFHWLGKDNPKVSVKPALIIHRFSPPSLPGDSQVMRKYSSQPPEHSLLTVLLTRMYCQS